MDNKLKEFRNKAKLSKTAVANRAGLSGPGVLYHIEEKLVSPRLDTAYRIAKVLGRPVCEIWPDNTVVFNGEQKRI